MTFERARQIADAVLYEGYVLYPYRASARKNQVRWQFGIAAPRQWSDAGGCEPAWMQTECLIDATGEVRLCGQVRFLQVQRRSVEKAVDAGGPSPVRLCERGRLGGGLTFHGVESLDVDGQLWTTWDEAVERTVDCEEFLTVGTATVERLIPFAFPGGAESEDIRDAAGALVGRCVRERRPIAGVIRLHGTAPSPGAAASHGLLKVRVRVENVTPWSVPQAPRDEAMRSSFLGLHTLLAVEGGAFVSLIDPPDRARDAAATCANVRTWPVLVGDEGKRNVMLSSPIILYDYPQIAPESPGDLYDATEIDEILTLRTMTLTEAEQREARATDPRAAAIIDRATTMPQEMLDKLHGAIRYLRGATDSLPSESAAPPWWDPAADASVSPDTDCIEVNGVALAKGSRVRLRPGTRRSDAQDMFLAGRTATVEGVFFDVDEKSYLAVTLDDDPAAELYQWHGRYLYFAPDEVEPLEVTA